MRASKVSSPVISAMSSYEHAAIIIAAITMGNERVRLMNEAFFDAFNVQSPGMELVSEGEAPYQVILKVDTFERAQGPGVMGSCYISIYGTLSVVDTASGDTVLEVKVNNVKGDTDFNETDRFPKAMKWFCRDLFKLKK